MNSLKTLGVLVCGAILLAALYAGAYNNSVRSNVEIDADAGVGLVVSGDRGEFSINEDGLSLKAVWRGDYDLSEDGENLASLEHKFEITREQDGVSERAVFKRDGDKIERLYERDGEELSDNEEAARRAGELFENFLNASGLKAEERVEILLRKGGPDAVIAEIDKLRGDYARQHFAAVLTEQTNLQTDQLRALLDSLKAIEDDDDMRQALNAILENETITATEAPLILEAAGRIESSYDMRRLIETVAEKPMGPEAIDLAITMLGRIDSDHDVRRAAEALLEDNSLTEDEAARLLAVSADHIDSDHDLRLLLGESVSYLQSDGPAANAWIAALDAIDSDNDLRHVIGEASDNKTIPDGVAEKLIEATAKIDSSNDRRLALEGFAARAKTSAPLLAAYEAAARDISSSSDRARALQAAGLTD